MSAVNRMKTHCIRGHELPAITWSGRNSKTLASEIAPLAGTRMPVRDGAGTQGSEHARNAEAH